MSTEFEPKNKVITLSSEEPIAEKIVFVRNLHDKAHDKINHFDKIRQQNLNIAIIVFSALLAFILKEENEALQIIGCFGVTGLMVIFRYIDQRYHKSTHGLDGSKIVFNQVIAHLLNNTKDEVSFLQYHEPSEKTVQPRSLMTIIYFSLGVSAFMLGVYILFKIILH